MTQKQRYRLGSWALLGIFILLAFPYGSALASTPTPAPTPSPLPPGFNGNSNFSVDSNAALPWPLPQLPTFPAPSATPTLYNATPLHGTSYAGSASTATAQVGQFTGPVNSITTPVAALIGTGPTPVGGDLNTGVDVGTGTISFSGFATSVGDSLGPVVGTGVGFIQAMIDLSAYTPAIGIVIAAEIIAVVIGLFLALIPLIIRAGEWLVNFVIRLFTLIGSFIPG